MSKRNSSGILGHYPDHTGVQHFLSNRNGVDRLVVTSQPRASSLSRFNNEPISTFPVAGFKHLFVDLTAEKINSIIRFSSDRNFVYSSLVLTTWISRNTKEFYFIVLKMIE
ncbi:hypothetical protein J6590_071234 [Homalodisca vitripennis]|nr:hypothetical protein J6590_071234 [Homalodisca vitripennis]